MGYRIETSFMVALLAVAAWLSIAMFVWSVARGDARSPDQVSLFFRHRRAMKGYLAITRGLIAIGAGDLRAGAQVRRRSGAAVAGRPLCCCSPRNRRRWPATVARRARLP